MRKINDLLLFKLGQSSLIAYDAASGFGKENRTSLAPRLCSR